MARIGIPVSAGFTVSTEACEAYLDSGSTFPDDLREQVLSGIEAVESVTGKRFGDENCPLLVSCRSGTNVSTPGMMETVPNVGLNDQTVLGLICTVDDHRFVYDAYRKLIQRFGYVVTGIDDEPFDEALGDVFRSASAKDLSGLSIKDWGRLAASYKDVYRNCSGYAFPEDPYEQLGAVIAALFGY